MSLLVSVLLAVELGGGFGTASATVVSADDESLVVDLRVEVASSADSVVVHLLLPGEEQTTLPLLPRDGGGFGITAELRRADYRVVFETVGDPAIRSQPVALSALGVDVLPAPPPEDGEQAGEETATGWMWLAVAFATASLSALAFWVLGGEDRGEEAARADQGEGSADSTSPA